MATRTRNFLESLNRTRGYVRLLVVAASVLILLSVIGGCGDTTSPDRTVLDISGTILGSDGLPANASITLERSVGFADYTPVTSTSTDAAGHYALSVELECQYATLRFQIVAPGHRTLLLGGLFSALPLECKHAPQTFDAVLSAGDRYEYEYK